MFVGLESGLIAYSEYNDAIDETAFEEYDTQCQSITVTRTYENRGVLIGFKNHPFRIFDLEKEDFSFKAKNVANDELDLTVPMFDTDICYKSSEPSIIFCATGFGQVAK